MRHGHVCLSEATAIMRYLAELGGGLERWFGETAIERALVEQCLSWHHTHTRQVTLEYTVPSVLLPAYRGAGRPSAKTREKRRAAVSESLEQLAGFLGDAEHVAIDRVTAADLFIASDLFELDADPERGALLDAYPRIDAWLDSLRARPACLKASRVWTALVPEILRRLSADLVPGDPQWVADFCERVG